MRPERKTTSGKLVLAAVLGLSLFIAVGVMLIALATRRPLAPPPMPRENGSRHTSTEHRSPPVAASCSLRSATARG